MRLYTYNAMNIISFVEFRNFIRIFKAVIFY